MDGLTHFQIVMKFDMGADVRIGEGQVTVNVLATDRETARALALDAIPPLYGALFGAPLAVRITSVSPRGSGFRGEPRVATIDKCYAPNPWGFELV